MRTFTGEVFNNCPQEALSLIDGHAISMPYPLPCALIDCHARLPIRAHGSIPQQLCNQPVQAISVSVTCQPWLYPCILLHTLLPTLCADNDVRFSNLTGMSVRREVGSRRPQWVTKKLSNIVMITVNFYLFWIHES